MSPSPAGGPTRAEAYAEAVEQGREYIRSGKVPDELGGADGLIARLSERLALASQDLVAALEASRPLTPSAWVNTLGYAATALEASSDNGDRYAARQIRQHLAALTPSALTREGLTAVISNMGGFATAEEMADAILAALTPETGDDFEPMAGRDFDADGRVWPGSELDRRMSETGDVREALGTQMYRATFGPVVGEPRLTIETAKQAALDALADYPYEFPERYNDPVVETRVELGWEPVTSKGTPE